MYNVWYFLMANLKTVIWMDTLEIEIPLSISSNWSYRIGQVVFRLIRKFLFEVAICLDIFIVMHYIAAPLLIHLKLINDIYLKVKYRKQTQTIFRLESLKCYATLEKYFKKLFLISRKYVLQSRNCYMQSFPTFTRSDELINFFQGQ